MGRPKLVVGGCGCAHALAGRCPVAGDAEADVRGAAAGSAPAAGGAAEVPPRRAGIRAAAEDARETGAWVLPPVTGVVRIRRVDAAHPLPDVAGHVLETVRARAARMVADRSACGRASYRRRSSRAPRRPDASYRSGRRGLVVAPREAAAVDAAGRLLPLGLGRQARPGPATEGGRVVPVDVRDGMPLERVGDGSARPVRRGRMSRGAHELPVLRVRDRRSRRATPPRRRRRAAAPRRAAPARRAARGSFPSSTSPAGTSTMSTVERRAGVRDPRRAGSRRSGRRRRAACRAGTSTGSRPLRG